MAPNYVNDNNLKLHLHSARANGFLQGTNSTPQVTTFPDLKGNVASIALTAFGYTTSSGWAGSGTELDPYCLVFDGTDDYVSALTDVDIDPSTNFSVETWVKFGTATGFGRIVYHNKNSTNWWQLIRNYDANKIIFATKVNSATEIGRETVGTQASGEWVHVVATYGAGAVLIYINGSAVSTISSTGSTVGDVGFRLMRKQSLQYGTGAINLVRFYNKTLSSAEVTQNYNSGKVWDTLTFVSAGQTTTRGSLTIGKRMGIGFSGLTQSSGSLTLRRTTAIAGLGQTSSSGTLDMSKFKPIGGSGLTTSSGSAVLTNKYLGIRGSGRTQSSGTLAVKLHGVIRGSGLTQSSGVCRLGKYIGVSASGKTTTSGSIALKQNAISVLLDTEGYIGGAEVGMLGEPIVFTGDIWKRVSSTGFLSTPAYSTSFEYLQCLAVMQTLAGATVNANSILQPVSLLTTSGNIADITVYLPGSGKRLTNTGEICLGFITSTGEMIATGER